MYGKFNLLAFLTMALGLIAGSANAQPLQQDPGPDGIVSVEAENYDANVEVGGHAWVLTGPTGGFTGTAGMWAPNGQGGGGSNYAASSERLEYEINFVKTGMHYVWILAWGASGSDDSCHVGLDGEATPLSSQMSGWNDDYEWNNGRYQEPGPSRIDITSTGPHTLNIWVREDGLIIDKIVVASNPDFSLSGNEPGPPESIRSLVLNAYDPDPADGALHAATWANLGWKAGETAVSHDVYLGENFDDVNSRSADTFLGSPTSPFAVIGFLGLPYPDGLVPGTTYYWRVDEVEADGTTKHEAEVWSFRITPRNATEPSPADGAVFQDTDLTLTWSQGLDAKLQTVYLGDTFEDVNSGTVEAVSRTTTDYTPGQLEPDKTYYWRVDQVDPPTTVKGDVWSFTTLPEIPISDPNLVGWWKFEANRGTKVVDWSGHGNHGTISGAANVQWVSSLYNLGLEFLGDNQGFVELPPDIVTTAKGSILMWINTTQGNDEGILWYGCDVSYGDGYGGDDELHLNIDDPGAGEVDLFLEEDGSGSDITINGPEVGGQGWTHVAATWDLADGLRLYVNGVEVGSEPHNTNVKNFVIMRLGNAGEGDRYYEGMMDDVRLFDRALSADEVIEIYSKGEDPLRSGSPQPANNFLVDLIAATPLSWSPGEGASEHDVYFGTDRDAVDNANATDTSGVYRGRQNTVTYTPSEVEWAGGPYYWRIDEILSDGTIVKGGVWSFTVTDYLIIDDFELYNDTDNFVWDTWKDGYDNPNTNGAAIGYVTGASMETDNAQGGSGQSAPMTYDNTTAPISEATRTFSPAQNWAQYGITTLSLFVSEALGNVGGDVYVKINGVKAPLVDESTYPAGFNPGWVQYNVDLTAMNISNVRTLTIGVDGANAQGTIFVDDIRLYREAPDLQSVLRYLAPIIEAESGIITAPFEVLSNIPGASGGRYIIVPNGGGSSGDAPAAADNGWATYTIDVPADGEYVIGLRGLRQVAGDGGDDSFWVRIPDAVLGHVPYLPPDWIRCGAIFPGDAQDVMVWDLVRDWFGDVPDVDPVVFTLTAGQHELQISRREDGTALDAIAIFSVE